MTSLRWMILAALMALGLSLELLPGRPTHTRPVGLTVDGLPAAVIGVFQR